MKSSIRQQDEYNYQIKKESERLEKREIASTWKYWKRTPLNKRRRKKKEENVEYRSSRNQQESRLPICQEYVGE